MVEKEINYLPAQYRVGLFKYYVYGIRPGDFLCAVLSNNLVEATTRIDNKNNLSAIVMWFLAHFPGNAWGSVEKMETHLSDCKEAYRQHEAKLILQHFKEKTPHGA